MLGREQWGASSKRTAGSVLAAIPATQLFVLSFGVLIAVGTLGFLLLPGLYVGPGLGLVDALFMATSAVCVTGLTVVDTATYFTPLGQAWIALLIQLGGLGMLTFTTLLILLLGRRATLHVEEAAGSHAFVLRHLSGQGLIKRIVAYTFSLEAAGAVVLWLLWRKSLGTAGAVGPAVFHAISAFSNAGFSVFSSSLADFQRSPLTLLTISSLIIVGGLGFVVLADLRAHYLAHRRWRIGTHTRLVLLTSGILLVGGTLLYLLFESGGVLSELAWPARWLNAFFMAVTPRTAGFNTVDYNVISNPALFLTMLLMIIGGSPGSTAGGMKTTTIALLALAFVARLRGKQVVSVWGRTVPEGTVQRAAGLAIGALSVLALAFFLLAMTEFSAAGVLDRTGFVQLLFEAHSAFGTVGLSMGTTPVLTTAGRLIITGLMFIGRIGPLAIASAMAFAEVRAPVKYRYSYEDVVVG